MVFLSLAAYSQPRRRRTVPATIGGLLADHGLLESLITQIYGFPADRIDSINVSPLTSAGIKGNLSDSARLKVCVNLVQQGEGDDAAVEYHWFVKIRPDNANSAITDKFNIFKNEIEFYQKIVPEMKDFLLNEGFTAEEANFDIPQILYAKEEEEDGAIIILEDVMSQGYTHKPDANGDKFLNLEQALTAVRSIARLHAVSVAMQQKRHVDLSEEHPTLVESGLLWTQAEMTSRLADMKDSYCELLRQSDELDSPKLLSRFLKRFDSEERLIELCQQRCVSTPTTHSIQHGDFHFNNLMFKETEEGKYALMIVDWQLTYTGKNTGDLSYLLMSSLSHEMREEHETQIKTEYFNVYTNTLDKIVSMKIAREEEKEILDKEYTDSLPLSFLFSCGNIMAMQEKDKNVQFSYDMCKEAVEKEII